MHPWASVYKVMFEFQPQIWEVGITAHLLCAHQGKSPQTAAVKLSSHKRRVSKPSCQQAGVHGWKSTGLWKSNCLQDMMNVRKAVYKTLPDLSQRTEVWSTLVQDLTPLHIHRPQRCCQVKSMSHGYLQYPFSAVFIHHYHCSSAEQPESHGEVFCPHFICTHFPETQF